MTKLSAVIITYNEEKNIARCLQSLLNVCDEIVVIDSFSTDRTAEICNSFGVVFIRHEWLGYSGSKNTGNDRASYDWILSIDADEALSDELAESVLHAKQNFSDYFYSFNRLTNYCGKWIKHSGWYPDKKIRIFNRQKAHWEGTLHEKLVFNKNINVQHLKGDLLHYSYYTIEEHEKQIEKYSSISARELKAKGKKAGFFHLNILPFIKFIETYIFKAGFMDGVAGYRISKLTAEATRLKFQKLDSL